MRNSAAFSLLIRGVSLLAPLAAAPVLARALGPDGRGESGSLISLMILLPVVLSWGAPVVLRVVSARDHRRSMMYLRSVRVFAGGVGLVVAIVLALCAPALLASLSPNVVVALCVTVPVTVATGILWTSNGGVLVGQGSSVAQVLAAGIPGIAFSVSVYTLWGLGILTVEATLWAQAASYFLTFLASEGMTRVPWTRERVSLRELLRSGARFAPGQIAEAASYRLDQVVVLPLLGAYMAGQYAVAVTISLLPLFVAQVVAMALFRQSSDDQWSGEDSDRLKVIRLLGIVGFVVGAAIACVTPFGIPFVFGSEYAPAVFPTIVGLAGSVFLALSQGSATLLSIQQRGWLISGAQSAGLVVAFALLLLLTPPLGVTGAAVASTCGYALSAVIMVSVLRPRLVDLTPRLRDITSLVSILRHGRY